MLGMRQLLSQVQDILSTHLNADKFMNYLYRVKLVKSSVIITEIPAGSWCEAKRIAEHQFKGYRFISATRL